MFLENTPNFQIEDFLPILLLELTLLGKRASIYWVTLRFPRLRFLTFTMLIQNIPCIENSVDPDQLASQKPADQDPHCFPLSLYILLGGMMQLN